MQFCGLITSLKTQLKTPHTPCLGSEQTVALPRAKIDPSRFLEALKDPVPLVTH